MVYQTLRSKTLQLTTPYNFKLVILLVSIWIFTMFLSSSFNVGDPMKSPSPMYYYTTSNRNIVRKGTKVENVEIDTSFIEELDSAEEDSEKDIFYDTKNGNFGIQMHTPRLS